MDANSNIAAVVVQMLEESSSDSSLFFEYFFESSSSSSSMSSSTSDSEEEILSKVPKVETFLDEILQFTDVEFKQNFRLSRNVAEKLISAYTSFLEHPAHGGRIRIPANGEIFITLWFLANTESYRQISERFNCTSSTVHRILYRVVDWLVRESYNYIKWPNALEMRNNQTQFLIMNGLPGVIGAIDNTHIKVTPPKYNKELYYNSNQYFSLLVQGIVNADQQFIDVHCGEPGSMDDVELLEVTKFFQRASEDESLIIPGGVLLADSSYPEYSFIVPPFRESPHLTTKQKNFNVLHNATRMVVENAFSLLKSRFQRLNAFETRNLGFIANCIVVTCVLHNMCLSENDYYDVDYLDDEVLNDNYHLHSEEHNNIGARQIMFELMDNEGLLD